ncbi:MAG: DUF2071 domain-containing protein [Candidatus Hydrogenedentes bacterium]|nr:DUF2071 domain-containing protein [Candidatus Hydrogenedentota bacterium]
MNSEDAARSRTRVFLSAEWRYLAMLNYPIEAEALRPLTPRGTELDLWQGEAYVSLVGFLFLDTRIMGVPIPFHRNFEEVNLRFYVRRKAQSEWRRGVVFVKEFVPRRAIAAVARALYNENYVAASMAHSIDSSGGFLRPNGSVEYAWTARGAQGRLSVTTVGEARMPAPDSHEAFIAEHNWGYTRQRNGGTKEYRVEHPPWKVWASQRAEFEGDVRSLYGERFVECLSASPKTAFVADGSPITVGHGLKLAENAAHEKPKLAPITEIEPTAPYNGRH